MACRGTQEVLEEHFGSGSEGGILGELLHLILGDDR
jgi:hypothetical protein